MHRYGGEPRWTDEVVTRADREPGCRILESELYRWEEVAVKVDGSGRGLILINDVKLSNCW